LGLALLTYAHRIVSAASVPAVIGPALDKLRDLTGETATFHLPAGTARVCILERESRLEIRRTVGVGRHVPLYAGASGRAILAYLPEQEVIISALPEEQQARVRALLEETRQRGYAISHEESTPNVAALAAPLFDPERHCILGSISISGPIFRWHRDTMAPFIDPLLEAARQLQRDLST
jgi:DNA-binding IclR family transcriptional regulator